MTLLHVADAAYPPPIDVLPSDLYAIAGYVGGSTPHVWTAAERRPYLAHGLRWWGIWTLPQRAVSATDGHSAARGQIAAYKAQGYPSHYPALLDMEEGTWSANVNGARAAIAAWQSDMHAAGWSHAVPYVPESAGFGWVANWTGIRPSELPPKWVGQQYAGNAAGGAIDLSVFDPIIVGNSAPGRKGKRMFELVQVPGAPEVYAVGVGLFVHVPSPRQLAALQRSALCASPAVRKVSADDLHDMQACLVGPAK